MWLRRMVLNEKIVLLVLFVVSASLIAPVLYSVPFSLPRSFLVNVVLPPVEETTSIERAMRLHRVLWDHALVHP